MYELLNALQVRGADGLPSGAIPKNMHSITPGSIARGAGAMVRGDSASVNQPVRRANASGHNGVVSPP